MKRFLLIFLFFLYGITAQSILFAQQDTSQFICSFSSNDSSYSDGPGLTPLADTTNMAIILCAEKGSTLQIVTEFLEDLKEHIPDYFDKATFGNYKVNVSKVLVKSIDSLAGTATLFELPDTVWLINPPLDTNFVVQPWLV